MIQKTRGLSIELCVFDKLVMQVRHLSIDSVSQKKLNRHPNWVSDNWNKTSNECFTKFGSGLH
jgi:hypothetical protein